MRLGQICHMDIVANGRAIWCRVIGTEKGEILDTTKSGLYRPRNKMGFGVMILSGFSRLDPPRRH